MLMTREQLGYEERIVWLEDVARLDYVREWTFAARSRTAAPRWKGLEGRLVGYAVLRADAPRDSFGCYVRRLFFLKDHDRDRAPDDTYHARRPGDRCAGGCPTEAVDPRTVAAGVPGVQNERAWGGPLPRQRDGDDAAAQSD